MSQPSFWKSCLHGLGVATVALSVTAALGADAPKIDVGGLPGAGGGSIKGVVKFEGKQVRSRPIRMDADKFCVTAHDKPVTGELFVFGDNDTLQNVFVYVSKGVDTSKVDASKFKTVVDQHGCMYVPHVVGAVAGAEVDILNSDSTLHNVNCQPKVNGGFNEGMPVKGMKIAKSFPKAEMGVPLKCDVHPWMSGYINVVEHPYYAVTQQAGTFEIVGLPPGEYEVSVWHEFEKFQPREGTVKVTVTEGQAAEANFTYLPPNAK